MHGVCDDMILLFFYITRCACAESFSYDLFYLVVFSTRSTSSTTTVELYQIAAAGFDQINLPMLNFPQAVGNIRKKATEYVLVNACSFN